MKLLNVYLINRSVIKLHDVYITAVNYRRHIQTNASSNSIAMIPLITKVCLFFRDSNRANANAGCSVPHSPTGSNDNIGNCASDDDIEITKLAEGETNKHASLGNLSDNHFDTILSPTG